MKTACINYGHILKEKCDVKICKLVQSLGVPTSLLGYYYICVGVSVISDESNQSRNLMDVYKLIAEIFDISTSRVERGIRHAIEVSYMNNSDELNKLFNGSVNLLKRKPQNTEFLHTTALKYMELI